MSRMSSPSGTENTQPSLAPFQTTQPHQQSTSDALSLSSSPGSSAVGELLPGAARISTASQNRSESLRAQSPTEQDVFSTQSSSDSVYSSSSPSPSTRPNKYHGPPSTWRTWTAPERELAASLDQIQAANLSIHLYNAFALKGRAGARSSRKRRKVALTEDDDDTPGEVKWTPKRVWTAWPMRADEVPREDDSKKWEEDNPLQRPPRRRPQRSIDLLEEMLVARVLQKAKERFERREWEHGESANDAGYTIRQGHTKTPGQSTRSRLQLSSSSTGNLTTSENVIGTLEAEKYLKPVMIVDDDLAATKLRPSIRHVLSQFDALLMGLHRARASYAHPGIGKRSKSQKRKNTQDPSRSARKRKATRSQSHSRHGSRSQSHPDSECDSESQRSRSSIMSMSPPPSGRSGKSYKTTFAPVDWSSVLGIASLTAWDPTVVQGAAERCATLFEEKMAFRQFDMQKRAPGEGGLFKIIRGNVGTGDGVVGRGRGDEDHRVNTGNIIDTDEEGAEDETIADNEEMYGGVHVDGYLHPIEGRRWWGKEAKKQRASASRGRSRMDIAIEQEL